MDPVIAMVSAVIGVVLTTGLFGMSRRVGAGLNVRNGNRVFGGGRPAKTPLGRDLVGRLFGGIALCLAAGMQFAGSKTAIQIAMGLSVLTVAGTLAWRRKTTGLWSPS